jgi:hypothetical protein
MIGHASMAEFVARLQTLSNVLFAKRGAMAATGDDGRR